MAKSKDPPGTPDAQEPQLLSLTRGDVVIRVAELVDGAKMYNGIVNEKLLHILPPELNALYLFDHFGAHINYVFERAGVMRVQTEGTANALTAEEQARELLDQVKSTIDGNYLQGDPRRGPFFPVGAGPHTSAQRLRAVEAGVRKHGLVGLASGITADSIGELATKLTTVDNARDTTGATREAASAGVENLLPTTRSVRKRLAALLRGYFGKYNPKLATFGLKVRTKTRARRLTPEEKALREEKRAAKKVIKEAEAAVKKQAKKLKKQQHEAALKAEEQALQEQVKAAQAAAAGATTTEVQTHSPAQPTSTASSSPAIASPAGGGNNTPGS